MCACTCKTIVFDAIIDHIMRFIGKLCVNVFAMSHVYLVTNYYLV